MVDGDVWVGVLYAVFCYLLFSCDFKFEICILIKFVRAYLKSGTDISLFRRYYVIAKISVESAHNMLFSGSFDLPLAQKDTARPADIRGEFFFPNSKFAANDSPAPKGL